MWFPLLYLVRLQPLNKVDKLQHLDLQELLLVVVMLFVEQPMVQPVLIVRL